MASMHQGRGGLPEVFPIFPLSGALLLPHGRLPLNIFEPRYLAMTDDSLAAGRVFGMIQPEPGRSAGATGPATFRVGCLGRLTSFSETDDGRYLITLTGLIRFRVGEELEMRRGYRRIRGDYAGFEGDLAEDAGDIGIPREDLLRELRGYFGRSGVEANWDAIDRMPDDMLVVTLCMVCPFAPAEKQALLEAPNRQDRAHALFALLSMGGREDEANDRIAS
jgi:uncharacterized protein